MSPSLRKRSNTADSRSVDGDDDEAAAAAAGDYNHYPSLDAAADPASSPMIILFEDGAATTAAGEEGVVPLIRTAPTQQGRALMAAISQVAVPDDNPAGLTKFKVYVLTLCAVLQAVVLLVSMHLFSDRHNKAEMYELRHVTILSHLVKLGLACTMESIATQGNLTASLRLYMVQQPADATRMLIPTVLYSLQDWLAHVAVTHLSPGRFRFIQEMRIVIMAVVSMQILKTSYTGKQWLCLVGVWAGMYLSTVDHALSKSFWPTNEEEDGSSGSTTNSLVGYGTVVGSVLCFVMGSVYFEHVVKRPNVGGGGGVTASVWMRIIQLSLFSMIFHGIQSMISMALLQESSTSSSSFFIGFGPLVWTLVISQGCASAVMAAAIYFTDNVLKCLAITVGSTVAAICYAGTWESESSGIMFVLGCVTLSAGVWFYCTPLPEVCRHL